MLRSVQNFERMIRNESYFINPFDQKVREGYLANAIPFHSQAEIVKDIGPDVTKFGIGDKVFTRLDLRRNGTYAEYVAVDENIVAKKPENLSF